MTILDYTKFIYCPRCGKQTLTYNDEKSLICGSCGFLYYHSSTAAAVAIIEYGDKIILTRRANEPHKGFLSLPGGFVDYEESLEEALKRELKEELNLIIASPTYLCSHGDRYLYRNVLYFSVVAFFVVKIDDISGLSANDDIDAFYLVRPGEIDYNEIAFESDRVAINRYRNHR